MARFRHAFYKLIPSWLSNDDGERYWYAWEYMLDAFMERCRQTVLSRFPQYAPDPAALRFIGSDRGMPRGLYEADESYARRLVNYRGVDAHLTRGNAVTMVKQIAAYLPVSEPSDEVTITFIPPYAHTVQIIYDAETIGDPEHIAQMSPPTPVWSTFEIWIDGYPGWSAEYRKIGDPTLWNAGKIGGGYVIGINGMTGSQRGGLISLIKYWKPAGTRLTKIVTNGGEINV